MLGEGIALFGGALGIQFLQVERQLFYGLAHALLYPVELGAAYLGERGVAFARVFGENVHLLDGHVQDVAAAVFYGDVFLGAVGRFNLFGTRYSAYAVLFVDGVVADFGRGEHVAPAAAYAALDGLCIDVAAAHDGELCFVQNKALEKLLRAQAYAAHGGEAVGQGVDRDIPAVERVGKFFEPLNPAGEYEHAVAARAPVFDVLNEHGHRIEV